MTSTPVRPAPALRPTGTLDLSEPRTLSRDDRSSATRDLLVRAAEADESSRQALLDDVVVLNMRVAEAVAQRFAGRGTPVEDLQQVAYMALVRAVRDFDVQRDTDLLSYAVPSMEGELRRHFRDHAWAVRPPREVQRAHARIMRSGSDVDRCDEAGLEELARQVDETTAAVREALVARRYLSLLSLDVPGLDTDTAPAADDENQLTEVRMVLRPVLAQLSPQERQVLHWRFVEELTQRAIAERMGATQVQVCRLLQRVLVHLRGALVSSS